MNAVVTLTGAIVVVLFWIALAASALAAALEAGRRLLERWRWDVIAARDAELGQQIYGAAAWFGCNRDAMLVLELLAERLKNRRSLFAGDGWRDDFERGIKARLRQQAESAG